ncbi:protein lurp-one-related 15 [Phtheirospermum japonicum]|uniref:Protein lurp-one-related 15 n=1 Tax=Phtheirospermum japonicum TaxID=374723 RepID=A0A830BD78_9LAMI|nr:protein lurp-one-related 15 [Phtheirospermum japonicum]
MMSGPNYPAVQSPVAVIGQQFCTGYPVDLTIVRKMMTLSEGNFGVTDVNGNLMFKIKGNFFSLHDRRVLLDAAGNPIITFQQKLLSARRRWVAFRGESTEPKDLLFSVRKSSLFQMKTKLDVFLASNTADEACDFQIKGSWFESSCVIYAGNSDNNNVIAQMHRNHSAQSILLGKDSFGVTVYPNVDYAFIVALVVLLEEINEDRQDS